MGRRRVHLHHAHYHALKYVNRAVYICKPPVWCWKFLSDVGLKSTQHTYQGRLLFSKWLLLVKLKLDLMIALQYANLCLSGFNIRSSISNVCNFPVLKKNKRKSKWVGHDNLERNLAYFVLLAFKWQGGIATRMKG